MALPDVCLALDYDGAGGVAGGAGPGAPSGADGATGVGPGKPPGSAANTGPTEGPLSMYAPGYGTVAAGWPTLMLTTDMRRVLYVQLFDKLCGGVPSDLAGIDHLKFYAKEWMTAPELYLDKDAAVVEPDKGLVKISFRPQNLPYAGIWPSAVVGFNADDEVVAEYKAWLVVQQSLTTAGTRTASTDGVPLPLLPHDVRLALRDTCTQFNTLLNDVEFSDVEIMNAIVRPVEEWNETSPDLGGSGFSYTQNTFPWREHWRRAACGYLLQAAAMRYVRNNLSYQAGGVAVNDMDKGPAYLGLSNQLLGEWREWLLYKKRDLNAQLCYGSITSISFGSPWNPTDRTW